MFNFNYYTPTEVVFGKDTELQAGKMVKKYGGTSVLLHYGGKSAMKSGLIDKVRKSLEDEGLKVCALGGVVPNPHLGKVREGVELAKANGVDPYYYIKYLLDIMPGYIRKNRPIEDAQSLFPWSDAFRAYADKERSSYLASLKAPPGNQKPKTPRMRDLIPVENTA